MILAKFEAGMEAMLDTFVFETSSLLEELDDILMRTENDELLPDDIAGIFRVMHTMRMAENDTVGFHLMRAVFKQTHRRFDTVPMSVAQQKTFAK